MYLAGREGPCTTRGFWLGHGVADHVDNGMTDRPVEVDENEPVGHTKDTVSGGGVNLDRAGEAGVCRVAGHLDLGAAIVRTGRKGSGRCRSGARSLRGRSSGGSHSQNRGHEKGSEIHLEENLVENSEPKSSGKALQGEMENPKASERYTHFSGARGSRLCG